MATNYPPSPNGHVGNGNSNEALGRETDGITNGRQELDLIETLRIVRRRWKIIALVSAIVFASLVAFTILQRKVYQSGALLVVSTESDKSADELLTDLLPLGGTRNVDTQVAIINSPDLLNEAFLTLTEKERLNGFDVTDKPPLWCYDLKSEQDTDVIAVTVRAFRPKLAAKFANRSSTPT